MREAVGNMNTIDPGTTGRKRQRRLPPRPSDGSFTIEEWCAHRRLSLSMYYKLKLAKKTPKTIPIGRHQIITPAADEEWERERAAEAASYTEQ
jgi:hypothetical protein